LNRKKSSLLEECIENSSITVVELLLKLGVSPNSEYNIFDLGDITALHHATENSDMKMLKLLIDNGGDINIKNSEGYTVLELIEKNIDPDKIYEYKDIEQYFKNHGR